LRAVAVGYGEVWKTLDELVIEFRRRGEDIPANVIEDLRAAKTMMQVWKADPSRAENIPSIEGYLNNVESYLIFTAHEKFGSEFSEKWMEKLREARKTVRRGESEEGRESSSKFVLGLPRGKKWVRVQISAETPKNEIKRLAAECGLSTRVQADGYMLVYGDDEKLKAFVQKTGEKFRSRKEV
jgi:hypothetical protein